MSDSPQHTAIGIWLGSIGMGQYADAFNANHLTLELLHVVTDSDLKECGVTSLGHRKQILAAIQQRKSEAAESSTPYPATSQGVEAGKPIKLGHFELLEELGSGGMGRVYRAWDATLNRQVAVKVLDRNLAAGDPQFFSNFVREAQNAAGINHPYIVQVYFAGEDAGEYYIAMELLEGQTLDQRIERGPMDSASVLQIAKQAIEALAATNARRLIHGDIKPENIFLVKDGNIKLLDFGLARKGNTSGVDQGGVFGSPYFVSPERASGQIEDFRSDIYSLGAVMFYAVSGMYPFEAEEIAVLVRKRLDEDAPPLRSVKPNASAELEQLLSKMMARDPAKRHQTYQILLSELAAAEGSVLSGFDPGKKLAFTIPGAPAAALPTAVVTQTSISQAPAKSSAHFLETANGPAQTVNPAGSDLAAANHNRRPGKPKLLKRILDNRFLLISILAHVLFVLVATIFVVQTIVSRKLTFTSAPASPNPSERSLEHEVSMAKKHNSMGAPVQAKRIATTGISKITLPEMPAISTATDFTPGKMAGMGGIGSGMGLGMGGSGGSGGGGGGGLTMFGLPTGGVGLKGHFYDLKQTRDRRPTNVSKPQYSEILETFVRNGWHEGELSRKYYKASLTLYATQILTPEFPAELAPKAYGVEKEVQPTLWAALYKGMVSAPESGVYHLVGAGDDVMIVRFNGENVLDRSWGSESLHRSPIVRATADYSYDWHPPHEASGIINGFARGLPMEVTAGRYYPIEILIGEQFGGDSGFCLLIEKEGVEYSKDSKGNPILPVFRLSNQPLIPPPPGSANYPPHLDNGPIWRSKPMGIADDDLDVDFN